ncbi:MAG: hypothetical protein TE42_04220 [Candidatus Synechococcus spongiarum SP3]|uniref:Uncharacterized protein n=1 Tax=Candidatus Synechococcus spongiarum SP3 TaxID=1604020 RepID=A0A0G2IWH6_9SYNE|nr:MAG: hypothetical protein TE42_04220 [Candidatus Synechococcus spongiarum SP3]
MNSLAFLALTITVTISFLNMNYLPRAELMFSGLGLYLLKIKAPVENFLQRSHKLEIIIKNLKIILNPNIFL